VKELFFHATAPKESWEAQVALEVQTYNALKPFESYLRQAIHMAKERQVRYQLKWEKVKNSFFNIRLEPLDSLLRFPRREPGMVLTEWPHGTVFDTKLQGWVKNRHIAISFKEATWTKDGLLIRADEKLYHGDIVIWCGIESNVRCEEEPVRPLKISDINGKELILIDNPIPSDDKEFWWVKIQGNLVDCTLIVDGVKTNAEKLPATENLQYLLDKNQTEYPWPKDKVLRVKEPPAEGHLEGNNKLRFRWRYAEQPSKQGCWIQLLEPDSLEVEEFIDPRATFCEGEIKEVWTQPKPDKDAIFKVKKIDQERYQLLLESYPPENTTLHLPVDVRKLQLQKRAIRQLALSPLPHHQGLIRLCEDPKFSKWPKVKLEKISDENWKSLRDLDRSGTNEQRLFVQKALGTQDFAFLEGPPGSGKTTAICEIVQQLVEDGKRVLLCASTHVAVDNVLERLLNSKSPIDAVRIGNLDRVDNSIHACQLDMRVEHLIKAWEKAPHMQKFNKHELKQIAERTVVMAANLTCGTTMGIVKHPLFQDRDDNRRPWEKPICTMPYWDVLILDEASKTLIQEFLVPAMMAKRWIIVGDIHQLPPFTERADIIANLKDLIDIKGNNIFTQDHQRACLLLHRLTRREIRNQGIRWLINETSTVLDYITKELEAKPIPNLNVVRLIANGTPPKGIVNMVTMTEVRAGGAEALRLASADWVLVGEEIIADAANLLPSNLLIATKPSPAIEHQSEWGIFRARQKWWLTKANNFKPYTEKQEAVTTFKDCEDFESGWLHKKDLASEITWRICRIHELQGRGKGVSDQLKAELLGIVNQTSYQDYHRRLLPYHKNITEHIEEIQDIGLPSILEVLQKGIGEDRAKRRSALTTGLANSCGEAFKQRFVSLTFQHRMHSHISQFPRELFYSEKALLDANTIEIRDKNIKWDFNTLQSRNLWVNVNGREVGGVNIDEIKAMEEILIEFIKWASEKGPPNRHSPKNWEVACLCFYTKQDKAISEMLRNVTGESTGMRTRFVAKNAPVEIICGTVDRFQGREADMVLLSMRNTRRTGFLDSPNRLNVAVTRARQKLFIFGNHKYFANCRTSELKELAKRTPQ